MFIGHFAVGLAAKRGTAASQALDLVWPVLVLVGVERVAVAPGITAFTPLDFLHYPWSHSLLMACVWGAAVAGVALALKRSTREALVLAVVVVSHWVLDWVSHRPDLPLAPGAQARVGLGLWQSVAATVVVEVSIFAVGVWVYLRSRAPVSRRAHWGFVALISFLGLVYAGNAFGPAPPIDAPPAAIAGPAMAMWLIVAWGAAVDRKKKSVAG